MFRTAQKKQHIDTKINLLPKDEFFSSPTGRVVAWTLSVGKYLVIFTEFIVIMSFFGRFALDRILLDLNTAIKKNIVIIEAFGGGEFEKDFRTLQKKLHIYDQIKSQANIAKIFPSLTELIPEEIELESLKISEDNVDIVGFALSNSDLQMLINNLQLSSEYYHLSINEIGTENRDRPGLSFTLSAKSSYLQKKLDQIMREQGANTVPGSTSDQSSEVQEKLN